MTARLPLPSPGTLDGSIPSSRRRAGAVAFKVVSKLLVTIPANQLVGSASQLCSYDSDLPETESAREGHDPWKNASHCQGRARKGNAEQEEPASEKHGPTSKPRAIAPW